MATKGKTQPQTTESTKCAICGKPLSREHALEKGMGDLCDHYLAQGLTKEMLLKHRATISLPQPPEGYIKVAQLDRLCKREGVPISRMVRAMGRDRSIEGPMHPVAQPVYVKNTRYIHEWLATKDGLEAIANLDFSKAPEVPSPFKS